jgi:hypothetical protein
MFDLVFECKAHGKAPILLVTVGTCLYKRSICAPHEAAHKLCRSVQPASISTYPHLTVLGRRPPIVSTDTAVSRLFPLAALEGFGTI